jgi:hypothetical protein
MLPREATPFTNAKNTNNQQTPKQPNKIHCIFPNSSMPLDTPATTSLFFSKNIYFMIRKCIFI